MSDQKPEVTRNGMLDCQVCIPKDWTDEQALTFVSMANPCGTQAGWEMRKQGSKYLNGANERVPCEEREGFVHIMFDA